MGFKSEIFCKYLEAGMRNKLIELYELAIAWSMPQKANIIKIGTNIVTTFLPLKEKGGVLQKKERLIIIALQTVKNILLFIHYFIQCIEFRRKYNFGTSIFGSSSSCFIIIYRQV